MKRKLLVAFSSGILAAGMGLVALPAGATEVIAPSAPTNVRAVATNNSAVVSWGAPANLGSPSVNSYTVTSHPDLITCTSLTTTCEYTGLTVGTVYTFSVTATNGVATSDSSAESAPVSIQATTAGTPPSAPTLSVSVKGSHYTLTWKAPTNRGSSAITGYLGAVFFKYSTGRSVFQTCKVTNLTCVISSAPYYGMTLSASVRAMNAAGWSDVSNYVDFTPGTTYVLFDSGSSALSTASLAAVKDFVSGAGPFMPFYQITVSGYSDTTGTVEQNRVRSLGRANAVVAELQKQIKVFTQSKVTFIVQGLGSTTKFSKTDLGQNRRVVITATRLPQPV